MPVCLAGIYRHFLKETALISRFHKAGIPPGVTISTWDSHLCTYSREMCVIRLHDAWARFCRNLVVQSAGCRALTLGGTRLPLAPGVTGPTQVINQLMATFRKRRWEPRWADPSECIDAAKRLSVANLHAVGAGVGLSPSPLDNLRDIRNFLAHRSADNAQQCKAIARSIGAPSGIQVHELLLYQIAPGVSILEKWIAEMQTMALLAVQ